MKTALVEIVTTINSMIIAPVWVYSPTTKTAIAKTAMKKP